VNLI
jgi:hypothetical protein